jgi:hypothetical protein
MGFIASLTFLLWHLSTPATIVASSTVIGRCAPPRPPPPPTPSPDSSFSLAEPPARWCEGRAPFPDMGELTALVCAFLPPRRARRVWLKSSRCSSTSVESCVGGGRVVLMLCYVGAAGRLDGIEMIEPSTRHGPRSLPRSRRLRRWMPNQRRHAPPPACSA